MCLFVCQAETFYKLHKAVRPKTAKDRIRTENIVARFIYQSIFETDELIVVPYPDTSRPAFVKMLSELQRWNIDIDVQLFVQALANFHASKHKIQNPAEVTVKQKKRNTTIYMPPLPAVCVSNALYSKLQSRYNADESLREFSIGRVVHRYAAVGGRRYRSTLAFQKPADIELFASPINAYAKFFGTAFPDIDFKFGGHYTAKQLLYRLPQSKIQLVVHPPDIEAFIVWVVENLPILNRHKTTVVCPNWGDLDVVNELVSQSVVWARSKEKGLFSGHLICTLK